MSGKVYARQLPPISGNRNSGFSRDSVSTLLRQKMLEDIKNSPRDAGGSLGKVMRIKNVVSLVLLGLFQRWLYKVPCTLIMSRFSISFLQLIMYVSAISVILTIVLYIFNVKIKWRNKKIKVRRSSRSDSAKSK